MRLAFREIATYREVCEFWDLDEVEAAHELLDAQDEYAEEQSAKAKAAR